MQTHASSLQNEILIVNSGVFQINLYDEPFIQQIIRNSDSTLNYLNLETQIA